MRGLTSRSSRSLLILGILRNYKHPAPTGLNQTCRPPQPTTHQHSITRSHRAQLRIPLHRTPAPVQYIDFESWKRRAKSGFFPMLDGDVVSRSVPERILRHARPIAADVRAVQMKNAHLEPFDAVNLALDVGYDGHVWSKSSPTPRSGKQSASILASPFAPSVCLRAFA